jgi:hypothetical protein
MVLQTQSAAQSCSKGVSEGVLWTFGQTKKKIVHRFHGLRRISFKNYFYFSFNPCKSVSSVDKVFKIFAKITKFSATIA